MRRAGRAVQAIDGDTRGEAGADRPVAGMDIGADEAAGAGDGEDARLAELGDGRSGSGGIGSATG